MARLRFGQPLWLDRGAPRPLRFSRLRSASTADVVIVGGGITGAIAAFTFAEAGLDVALIEARRVGHGSTAASTALLMQEPDKDFRELARRYGPRTSQRIWKAVGRATRDLIDLIRRLRIPCRLQDGDSVYYTLDRDNVESLRRELKARRTAGLPGRWLSSAAVERRTGIAAAGAILTARNARVDPRAACIGFLRHALAHGARVFEYSRARRVRQAGNEVEVVTAEGRLRAKRVVIATGYATREFKPLAGRFKMTNTYVIATSRLPVRIARHLAARRTMLWDTERPYHYMRWTDDGRLMFGGADRPHTGAPSRRAALEARQRLLRRDLERLFPVLAGCELSYAWEGLFAETSDGLPYIGPHARYPRHLFALGYGGNGMSIAYLAARTLLRHYFGTPTADDELFAFGRSRS